MVSNILLDIDGVIIRDPLLLEHVRYNVVEYVRGKLPQSKNPEKANRLLYKVYGHTGLGLQKAFRIDTRDFNKNVYNEGVLRHLYAILDTPQFKEDAKILKELSKDFKVTLFSNSPLEWSVPVRDSISHQISIAYDGNMKPDLKAYMNFPTDVKYIFVDDKTDNLMPTVQMQNWTPIKFSEEKKKDSKFLTIGSMWELSLLANSFNLWESP
jgi:FMN phosphatase YigB (HAD superfamily)